MKVKIHFGKSLAVIIILTLISIFLVFWQSDKFLTESKSIEQNITAGGKTPPVHKNNTADNIETKNLTYDLGEDSKSEISIEYPALKSNIVSLEMTSKINKNIAEMATKYFDEVVMDSKELAIEAFKSDIPELPAMLPVYDEYLDIDDLYLSTSTNIFSYKTYHESYNGSAPHGQHIISPENIDLSNGKVLKISDLLIGNYKPTITLFLKNELYKIIDLNNTESAINGCKNCERILDKESIDYLIEQNDLFSSEFTLSKDGLVMIFQEYHLSSYVSTAGGQEILIPKSVLKDFIKRDW